MHAAFFTRKFPPKKGGMETFSWELTQQYTDQKTIVHYGKRQIDIVWVAPLLIVKAIQLRKTVDLFHLGDLVLGPIAPFIRFFTRKPVVVTVHALELTFDIFGGLYQWLLRWAMRSGAIDHYVAVSEFTAGLLQERGVPSHRLSVITHGVTPPKHIDHAASRARLCTELKILDTERPLLLTVGRLVRRKGVAWCIEQVLPKLAQWNPLYIVASDGPDREYIEEAIQRSGMQNNVLLTGFVSEKLLDDLYAGCDIWLSPNIERPGDAEGFGFVAIEAAVHGLPVIAADREGIPSAIHHEKNGILVEAEHADQFVQQVTNWLEHPAERKAFGEKAEHYTKEHFQWGSVSQQYHTLFKRIVDHAS